MVKTSNHSPRKHTREDKKDTKPPPHSWAAVRSLFTCKYIQVQHPQHQVQLPNQQVESTTQMQRKVEQSPQIVLQPKKSTSHRNKTQMPEQVKQKHTLEETNKKCKKMRCSGSLCNNTKVMQKPEILSFSSSSSSSYDPARGNKKRASLVAEFNHGSSSANRYVKSSHTTAAAAAAAALISNSSSSSSSNSLFTTVASNYSPNNSKSGSWRNMGFRKLSGCYECRMVIDPVVLGIMSKDPSLRSSVCSCPHCGEIFMKADNLEVHQIVKHAVSELGPEDTSKNIVEIIFQSSWLKKQTPVCKIDRILKVQNTPRTISRFEEYRDSIKAKAAKSPKKHPRCIADGNELLRFHCTTLMCSLGLNGSSNLCGSIPSCVVCSIIKNGFKVTSDVVTKGILTTATSGKAHDSARVTTSDEHGGRAMLVCRVIAGRVKKSLEGHVEDYDSVAGPTGIYSNLDELYVFNPKAILPCFVVIYI